MKKVQRGDFSLEDKTNPARWVHISGRKDTQP